MSNVLDGLPIGYKDTIVHLTWKIGKIGQLKAKTMFSIDIEVAMSLIFFAYIW